MSGLLIIASLMAVPAVQIVSVATETRQGKQAVLIRASGPIPEASVRREGNSVIVVIGLAAEPGLSTPAFSEPIESLRLDPTGDGLGIVVGVAPEVPFSVQRNPSELAVVFGEDTLETPEERSPPPPAAKPAEDIRELYRRILPVTLTEPEAGPLTASGARTSDHEGQGLPVGPLTLRPAVMAMYMDAESTLLDSPTPVRDQYYEARPMLGGDLPLGEGRLKASYELRLRWGGAYPATRGTSHFADASADLPIGPSLVARGFGHYSRGILESQEVDPGGEYFFGLAPFRRISYGGGIRVKTGGRLDFDAVGSINEVAVANESSFFDYREQSAAASVGYDLSGSMRASLGYDYWRVPRPSERPTAETGAQGVFITVNGEILPLLPGEIRAGYRRGRSPNAGPGGTRYEGMVADVQLTREFGPAARVALRGGRSTPISSFEDDAFYVSTWGSLELTVPLPLGFAGRAAVGYHVNQYRTDASELDEPRRDQLLGWAVGIGRSIGRWGFARVDYRQDKRDSNLPGFDVDTYALTAQVGLGFFGTGLR